MVHVHVHVCVSRPAAITYIEGQVQCRGECFADGVIVLCVCERWLMQTLAVHGWLAGRSILERKLLLLWQP